jgi:exodeoxyribonuclease V beta subunit
MSIIEYPLNKNLFIEAGAGTGKTFSLEHIVLRILVEKKIPLSKIALLTFTKKAASELKYRIINKISSIVEETKLAKSKGETINYNDKYHCDISNLYESDINFLENQILKLDESWIGTIHSFCQKIILKYPNICKTKANLNFTTTTEFERLYKNLLLKEGVIHKYKYKDIETFFDSSFMQNKLFVYGSANLSKTKDANGGNLNAIHTILNETILPLSNSINESMIDSGTLLYDHLIYLVHENRKEIANKIKDLFQYLIVDEFQDTDVLQWEIFSEFAREKLNLIVVGDPKQSIYKFRGADVENYSRAKKDSDFQWKHEVLKNNFRSSPLLIHFFNYIFKNKWFHAESNAKYQLSEINYSEVLPSKLNIDMESNLGFLLFDNNEQFFEFTAKIIIEESLLGKGSVAVLCKSNADLKQVCITLSKYGIPWKFKNILWSDSREVQETIFLLDGILDMEESHKISLTRFWKIDPGLPNTMLRDKESIKDEPWYEKLTQLANLKNWSEFFLTLHTDTYLNERLKDEVDPERVFYDYQEIWERMESIAIERNFSMEELKEWIQEEKYNLELSTSSEKDSEEGSLKREGDYVVLMTIHSSKGLEFTSVFVPPCQQPTRSSNSGDWDLLHWSYNPSISSPPMSLCYSKDEKTKEQTIYEKQLEFRRLYYVAYTRAKANLYLGVKNDKFPNEIFIDYFENEYKNNPYHNNENIKKYTQDTKFHATKYVPRQMDTLGIDLNIDTPILTSYLHRGFNKKSFTSLSKKGIELPNLEIQNETYEKEIQEDDEPLDKKASLLYKIRGSKFGTIVHSLFEELDFKQLISFKNLENYKSNSTEYEIFSKHLKKMPEYANPLLDRSLLEDEMFGLLYSALNTHISEINSNLGSIPKSHILKEEDFFLKVAEGENSKQFQTGYLNGSIDMIFEYKELYYIVDWKSNYLGDDPKTIQETMELKMYSGAEGVNYSFQAYVYMIALYNILKSRNISDPLKRIGGAFFIFVRHNVYKFIKTPDQKNLNEIQEKINNKILEVGKINDR